MNTKERKDLAFSKVVLLVLAAAALIMVVWLAWLRPGAKADPITSFQACVDAGHPVQNSYPEVCRTPDGQQFPNPDQNIQRLAIEEWGVYAFVSATRDAYYTYNEQDATTTISTVALDNAVKEIKGCTSGLRPLIYDRAKPGDINPDNGEPWTEEQLRERGTKAGDYYYFEQAVIETMCMPDQDNEHVQIASRAVEAIRVAMRGVMQE